MTALCDTPVSLLAKTPSSPSASSRLPYEGGHTCGCASSTPTALASKPFSPLALLTSANSTFERKLHAYFNLRKLLTWEEWGLLEWRGRKLASITATHGIGPTTWCRDVKDEQLSKVLWKREAAWLKAASMYIAWEEVMAAGSTLQQAYKLYKEAAATAGASAHAELDESHNQRHRHNWCMWALEVHDPRQSDDVLTATMAPSAPEFRAICECLPRWTGHCNGSQWIKAGTKDKLG